MIRLAEVNTDKVTAEIPSSFAGTIKEIIAARRRNRRSWEVVCTIETEGGEAPVKGVPAKEEPANEMPAADPKNRPHLLNRRQERHAILRRS